MYQFSKNGCAPQWKERVDKSPPPVTMPVDNDPIIEVTATLPNGTPDEIPGETATPVHDEATIRINVEDQDQVTSTKKKATTLTRHQPKQATLMKQQLAYADHHVILSTPKGTWRTDNY
jgi:hypothetical protein